MNQACSRFAPVRSAQQVDLVEPSDTQVQAGQVETSECLIGEVDGLALCLSDQNLDIGPGHLGLDHSSRAHIGPEQQILFSNGRAGNESSQHKGLGKAPHQSAPIKCRAGQRPNGVRCAGSRGGREGHAAPSEPRGPAG